MSRSAPLIIVKNTQGANICNLKCAYQFDYATTSLQIMNRGDYLLWKVDEVNTPPVTYNDDLYNVLEARIYWKSLHAYLTDSTTTPVYTDAELIIQHVNRKNTKQLFVCVPITQSSTSTADSAMFFDFIMTEVARTAPSKGQQTSYNKSTFSLDKFVPTKPFYSYNGTFPWPPENGSFDYIVFDKEDAITMSPNAYSMLQKVITAHEITALSGGTAGVELFYNPNGPIPPNAGEIYIDCQPTGDDGEILVPAKLDSGGILDNELLKRMWNFTIVKIVVGFLVMIVLWVLASKILTSIAKSASKKDLGTAARLASMGDGAGVKNVLENS
jgi:carbonic anhydrase